MYNIDQDLETRVVALDTLLVNPRPEDSEWYEQLLSALEQVAEYSLSPGMPVRALSRTLAALPHSCS